ncbi:MAG: 2-keto-4-pentenoate hydratase/2-oxohepta-3-ene-1,7-dioic acid hydratase in catechol pathway [Enterobacterales bacterium]|jgi:2-keto-4-pentenoate hydratase/2-oxohepta-3-ene-1,7-dioic acid hydratase in catechol pathway
MKVMLVKEAQSPAFPIVSLDDLDEHTKWYRVSELLPTEQLHTIVEVLAFYNDNKEQFLASFNALTNAIKALNLNDVTAELPFQPLSYRDFTLFEEHYIAAKKGFIDKYYSYLSPFINIYERVANKTCPMLKPAKLWYEYPIYYLGNHLTFVKDGSEVSIPPYTKELDYELEIGAILCKKIKNASSKEAENAIGGFVIFNDFSARDVQADEMKCGFGPMKAKNFANSISNVVVTADEILPRLSKLPVSVYINDDLVIHSDTRDMYYTIAEAVAYASWEEQLYPGEFLATGTIPGCTGIENGQMLLSGDTIRLEVEGMGTLINTVK